MFFCSQRDRFLGTGVNIPTKWGTDYVVPYLVTVSWFIPGDRGKSRTDQGHVHLPDLMIVGIEVSGRRITGIP